MVSTYKHILCAVYLITILQNSFSQTVKSLTNPAQIQNLIQSKTICLYELSELDDFATISCPINYRISVINAILFDTWRNFTQCLPISNSDTIIKVIKNELQELCDDYNCSITKSFLINLLFNKKSVVNNLSLDVSWQCFMTTSTYAVVNPPTATYSFTYFFYIVTLVLSTSCILIGAIFILRKFLVLRRRNRGYLHARINRGFISGNSSNGDVGSNNIIWMTSCPPPAYENIYDSSFSVNRLPDYNSTILKTKIKKENESNLNSTLNQQQQQQHQQTQQSEQGGQDISNQEHLEQQPTEQIVQVSTTAMNLVSEINDDAKQELNNNDVKLDK